MDREASEQKIRDCEDADGLGSSQNQAPAKKPYMGQEGHWEDHKTVPRAELRAIHHCFRSLKSHTHIKHLTIYSDCKMAVDGIAKGRQYTSKTNWGNYGPVSGMNSRSASQMACR